MSQLGRTTGVRQILAVPGTKFGIVVAIGALALAGTGWASAADRPPNLVAGGAGSTVTLGPRATSLVSFTATEGGTYALDGTVSVAQTTNLAGGSNPELACTWRVGSTAAGPTFRTSLLEPVGLALADEAGSPIEVSALGQARLAAGESATFDCTATASALIAGAVRATAVTYHATKVA